MRRPNPIYIIAGFIFICAALGIFHPVGRFVGMVKSHVASDAQQKELLWISNQHDVVGQVLLSVQQAVPSFMRIKISIIHPAATPNADMNTSWQWDIIGVITAPGHPDGEMLTNLPLLQWNDYLGQLLAGQCAYVVVAELKNETSRARLMADGQIAFLTCPVMDQSDHLIGTIWGSWYDFHDVPKNLEPVKTSLRKAAATLAPALIRS